MGKEKLIQTIQKILATDQDFDFLMKLTETELETLVASIRGGWTVTLMPVRVTKLNPSPFPSA